MLQLVEEAVGSGASLREGACLEEKVGGCPGGGCLLNQACLGEATKDLLREVMAAS